MATSLFSGTETSGPKLPWAILSCTASRGRIFRLCTASCASLASGGCPGYTINEDGWADTVQAKSEAPHQGRQQPRRRHRAICQGARFFGKRGHSRVCSEVLVCCQMLTSSRTVVGYVPFVGYVTIMLSEHPWMKTAMLGIMGLVVMLQRE